jgi:hypothetical protein
MGTLFPDDEFPDHVPFPPLTMFPWLVIEAARANLLPWVMAALLIAASWRVMIAPASERFMFAVVPPAIPFEPEGPHVHIEDYVPLPHATQAEVGPGPSGAAPVPFVNRDTSNDGVIRQHWDARWAGFQRTMMSMPTTPAPVLWFAAEQAAKAAQAAQPPTDASSS